LSHQETKRDVLTVAPMGVLLVVPDGDILAGTIVVDRGTTLRTAGLRDTLAGGTSRGWGIQPGEYRTSRGVCHDFCRFSAFFFLKSQAPTHLTSLNHDMFPHSLSYLISCPISLILSFIFFRTFRLEGELGHLGLLGLETFGPWEDSTEDYLFWSDVDVPYKGVDPSLGSLLRLGYQPLFFLNVPHTR